MTSKHRLGATWEKEACTGRKNILVLRRNKDVWTSGYMKKDIKKVVRGERMY